MDQSMILTIIKKVTILINNDINFIDFPNNLFGNGVEILLVQDDDLYGYWENTYLTNNLTYICKMTENEVYKYNNVITTISPQITTLSPSNKCPNSPMYENNGYVS